MTTDAPREFWVDREEYSNRALIWELSSVSAGRGIHVIEKSAYDKLKADAEKLVSALELVERAYATHGERMAHQDYALKALRQWRGEE